MGAGVLAQGHRWDNTLGIRSPTHTHSGTPIPIWATRAVVLTTTSSPETCPVASDHETDPVLPAGTQDPSPPAGTAQRGSAQRDRARHRVTQHSMAWQDTAHCTDHCRGRHPGDHPGQASCGGLSLLPPCPWGDAVTEELELLVQGDSRG